MYCNVRKAGKLKKKMKKIFGRDQQSETTVHSVVDLPYFEKHREAFMNHKRVRAIWVNNGQALIQYK